MSFTGLASNEVNSASLLQRDIAELIRTLSPKETPFLDWLGDAGMSATSIKHEFVEDLMLPNTIIASTAINSATAATGFQIGGSLGLSLNVGQLIRNESANPEVMQISSIVGSDSIVVTRAYDGGATGSLVAGGTLYVGASASVEGADHTGADTRRLGTIRANTVGLFRMELAQSATQFAMAQVGNDGWEARKAKALIDAVRQLENEVIKGVWNGTNSLGTTSATRTFKGIQSQLTAINSTIVTASFVANPHLYIGNVWQNVYDAGGSPNETWGIVLGSTWYKAMSDLNDTKVQDSNKSETFQRSIRTYTGPFGSAELFLGRNIQATEFLLVPKERLVVPNLRGRSFSYEDIAKSGDNQKGQIVGEYTLELYHQTAMGRGHA